MEEWVWNVKFNSEATKSISFFLVLVVCFSFVVVVFDIVFHMFNAFLKLKLFFFIFFYK